MRLVIGNKNYSSWSLRAWLALSVTGAPFQEIVVPLDRPETAEKIAQYSPAGRVPVLIDGSLAVWDSLAIIETLAERYPDAGLWSADPTVRARQRSIAAEMHAGFADLRAIYPMNMRRPIGVLPPGSAQSDIERIISLWRTALGEGHGGGPYLFGPFSAADAMYAPVVSRFHTYAVAVDDQIRRYMDAVLANPYVVSWEEEARKEPWVVEAEEV